MPVITLPNNWSPRPYQIEVFRAFERGIKRFITVWHRRSGKDSAGINFLVVAAHKRVGNYWYLFPTQRQARRALWDAVDKQGRRVIDQAIPVALRESTRNDEMFIRLKNGSTIQVNGADQFDSLVGSNPVGVVMSEYAITSPQTWRYLNPILAENDGWIWFNSTPRGKNHLFDLWETNKNNPLWFTSIKSVTDTKAIPLSVIEEDIRAGMPYELAQQEYYCSFNAPNVGVVYAKQLVQARQEGRILDLPYDARVPVETWWDIGVNDATSIWFVQRKRQWLDVIDHYETKGHMLPHFVAELNKRGYGYNRHVGPHDLEHRTWAAGRSIDIAAAHGIHFVVAPKLSVEEGIQSARSMFSRLRFDAQKCQYGLSALEQYQYEWDEDKRLFSNKPVHDWSSHAADALRMGAVTPAEIGMIPSWAVDLANPPGGYARVGHNGGPPLEDAEFDPLSPWRGAPGSQTPWISAEVRRWQAIGGL